LLHRLAVCCLAAAAALSLGAVLAGPAAAGTSSSRATGTVATGTAATPRGKLHVRVDIKRFQRTRQGPVARGVATATLGSLGNRPTTVRKRVTLQVAQRGRCNILTLTLDTLDLTLLGLNVHLDRVELHVTGNRRGGVLGRLFCSLAGARVQPARVAAAKLNRRIARRGTVRPISFAVPLQGRAAQATATTCNVLELTLGPLHVDLLGLIIDLNRVHLTITANRNGGLLGQIFCALANGQSPLGTGTPPLAGVTPPTTG
jgi:hypothetical protein